VSLEQSDPEWRVHRWERRAEIPLLLLALAFVVAYVWPVLDPRLDPTIVTVLQIVSWSVWAAFVIDFAARIALARDRRCYLVAHWYDVLLVSLPMLRPLRMLRLLALARVMNRAASSLSMQVTTYVGGTAVVSLLLGAVAVLDAERGSPGANINTFGDALWWAASTVTTVGYGDRYPVTTEGRVIAVLLMLVGIALVGSITASVAAWFVRSSEESAGSRPSA
jgi:voltage-gated potassium channel